MLRNLLQFFATMFSTTYASDLEEYIVARKPRDVFDIERFQTDYNRTKVKFIWKTLFANFTI